MSGLIDGQYTIRVAAGSKPLVGVDLAFNALLVPVITDPIDFVWIVTKVSEEDYTLVFKNFGQTLYIHDDDGKLVGTDTKPASVWTISKLDNGRYTIRVPGCLVTKAWTVNNTEPKKPVTLNDLDPVPQENQQWEILRFTGPE